MNSLRLVYGIADRKIKMIYNGVDTNFRSPDNVSPTEIKTWKNTHGRNNHFVVTYYGHAGKSKGLDYLVQALPELVSTGGQLMMVFNLIDSKRTAILKEQIRKYHLGNGVQIFE